MLGKYQVGNIITSAKSLSIYTTPPNLVNIMGKGVPRAALHGSLMPPQSNQCYLQGFFLSPPLSIDLTSNPIHHHHEFLLCLRSNQHTTIPMRLEIPHGAPPWLCLGRDECCFCAKPRVLMFGSCVDFLSFIPPSSRR